MWTTSAGEISPDGLANDGVVIRVFLNGEVELVRGLTTSDQLYYHRSPRGGLIVSDHFAAVVGELSAAERQIGDAQLIDHMLFRTTPGRGTYVSSIQRVGNGERVCWHTGTGAEGAMRVARLRRLPVFRDSDEALEAIDHALRDAVGDTGESDFNLLSGGVDSTLVQSYSPDVQSLSGVIDSPEFGLEARYAEAAAQLFGLHHRFIPLREADYLSNLKDVVARIAMPPHHLQTVVVDTAAGHRRGRYFTAQFADALWGLDRSVRVDRIRRYGQVLNFL